MRKAQGKKNLWNDLYEIALDKLSFDTIDIEIKWND